VRQTVTRINPIIENLFAIQNNEIATFGNTGLFGRTTENEKPAS
jgi:hypothetical protein